MIQNGEGTWRGVQWRYCSNFPNFKPTRSLCARETMIISFYIFVKLHVFYIIYIVAKISNPLGVFAPETQWASLLYFYKVPFTLIVKYLLLHLQNIFSLFVNYLLLYVHIIIHWSTCPNVNHSQLFVTWRQYKR